jgi:hypothetical protein
MVGRRRSQFSDFRRQNPQQDARVGNRFGRNEVAATLAARELPMKYFAFMVGFGVLVVLFVVGAQWPDAVDQLISFMTGVFRSVGIF